MADGFDYGSLLALGIGALAGSKAGSGATQTGTSTTSSAPWAVQQPYLLDLFARAKGLSNNPGVNAGMTAAYQGMAGALNNPLNSQAANTISNLGLSGNANPYAGVDNPYLNSAIQNAQNDAYTAMNPYFQQQQRASGAYGNTGLAEAQTKQMTQQMGNIATQARMQDYQNQQNLAEKGINRQLNAAYNAPQFNTASMNNYSTLFNAANTMNNAQWQPLQNYGSLITGGYGGQSSSPVYGNSMAGALGGALAGSSIYSSLFNNKGG